MRRSSSRRFSVLAGLPYGPVIAVAAVSALWALAGAPTAVTRVPDMRGQRADVAATDAARRGFEVQVDVSNVGGVPGTIVAQRPPPRSFAAPGTPITLVITRGSRQVRVPDLAGLPVDEARRTLKEAGLDLGTVTYRVFADREPGRVVRSDPVAGRQVDEGTTVDLVSVLPD